MLIDHASMGEFRSWWDKGTGRRPKTTATQSSYAEYWDWHFRIQADPYASMIAERRANPLRPIAGLDLSTGWPVLAHNDSFLLMVARAGGGKSSSVNANATMFAPGPVVNGSSRDGNFDATAMARSRLGTVWIDGAKGARKPGAVEARSSLLEGCEKRNYADKVANRLVRYPNLSAAARHNEHGDNPFFRQNAAKVLSAVLVYCATHGRPVVWGYRVLASHDKQAIRNMAAEMSGSTDPEQVFTGAMLTGFLNSYSGELSGTMTSAANSIEWWSTDDGQRSEQSPNFSFDEFAYGQPEADTDLVFYGEVGGILMPFPVRLKGRYDSYFIIDGQAEDTAIPRRLETITRMREAMTRRLEAERASGNSDPLPLYLCLDELARFPLPDLFTNLADARDRGTVFVGGVQNFQQVRDIYGVEAAGDAMSMWGSTIVAKGLMNSKDTRDLSDLTHRQWVQTHSLAQSRDNGRADWSPSVSEQQLPAMSPDEITRGHPDRDVSMYWGPDGHWNWLRHTPYFRDEPWLRIYLSAAERAVDCDLPLPPFALNGDYRHLDVLGLTARFASLQQRKKTEGEEHG